MQPLNSCATNIMTTILLVLSDDFALILMLYSFLKGGSSANDAQAFSCQSLAVIPESLNCHCDILNKKHRLLQTEFITVHNPEARGNILHEMIQVFLHLPGIIYVKKRMVGPHSGTGPEWALLRAERRQHVNLFPSQINIAQMSEKLDIYAQRMKNTQTLFFQKRHA